MKPLTKSIGKRYLNLRLHHKFLLPTVTVMLVAILVFPVYIITDQRNKAEARLGDKVDRITALLLSSNVDAIWNYQEETLRSNCETFFTDREITRLRIVDNYGQELIDFSKEVKGTHDIFIRKEIVKNKMKIATIEIVFTNYFIEKNLASIRNTILFLTFLLFLVIMVLISIVSKVALAPLKELVEIVRHFTTGDLSPRIRIRSRDELGKLAESVNGMAEELQRAEAELRKHRDNLRELVDARTAELIKTNRQLRHEIRERRQTEIELARAKERAESASRAKSAFLANMSHELRTPMNAILGFSQLIRRDRTIAPEHRDHLEIIRRGGEHLLALINDILDMSKIEAGKTTLNEKNFDLHHLMAGLEDMMRLKAEKKFLYLIVEKSPDIPRYVRTDETKLRQVLVNLIGNAVKFTKEGGVVVRAKTAGRENDSFAETLCFEIEDSGLGIAPEELAILFEPFAQTDTGRRSSEGTGLGLPISRKFVKLMGGDITVRSEPGKGALFTFDITVQAAAGEDVESKPASRNPVAIEAGQPEFRLLIVDDTPESRYLLVKLLQPFGFVLREAANGREAVDIWQDFRPHLIWMDIQMPIMNGFEAVKRIREIETSNTFSEEKGEAVGETKPQTIIIALTASTFEDERSDILEAGCDDFLRKPFRESDLFELIRRHIGVRFVYRDDETETRKTDFPKRIEDLSPELVSGIPDGLMEHLKKAAAELDVEEVERHVAKLRETHSELADILADFAYNFSYGKIVQIIESVVEGKTVG